MEVVEQQDILYQHLRRTHCHRCYRLLLKASDNSDGLLLQKHESSSSSEQEAFRLDKKGGRHADMFGFTFRKETSLCSKQKFRGLVWPPDNDRWQNKRMDV